MFLNELQTRKKLIDGQILKAGWNLFDRNQVRFEVPASGDDDDWTDGITDYSLYLPNGEIIAVVEAKKQSRSPHTARQQALIYAENIEQNQSFRPFVFLSNGIEICQGTFSEMRDDIYEMIDYFASRKKILYVHFRNVSGKVPNFYEEFVNTGYVDMYKAMKIYHKHNFDGFFIDDHVPHTHGDTPWGHRGRAFANGYIQAMIEAVQKGA